MFSKFSNCTRLRLVQFWELQKHHSYPILIKPIIVKKKRNEKQTQEKQEHQVVYLLNELGPALICI